MFAGYSSQCKVCNSPKRLEIEGWSKTDGKSSREISVMLHGEISHTAINSHMKEHYDVQAAAREEYYKSNENLEKDAKKRLTDIQILDELIQDNHILHSGVIKEVKDITNKAALPMPMVSLLNGTSTEICRAIKTKMDLLGENPGGKAAESFMDLIRLASESRSSEDNC
jgi:hypothetical protein